MLQPHYPRWRRRLKLIISVMFIILSLSVCAGIQLFIGIFLFDYGADGQAVGPEHMLGGGGGAPRRLTQFRHSCLHFQERPVMCRAMCARRP